MQASSPPSPFDRRANPGQSLAADDTGVSEVIGSILALATVTLILIVGFYGFSTSEAKARERVMALQAEAAAERVAATAVDAAVFAEAHSNATYQRTLNLPEGLEGSPYRIALESSPPRVRVFIPSSGTTVSTPLFGADAALGVSLCESDLVGGRLTVRHDDATTPGSPCVYLEAA